MGAAICLEAPISFDLNIGSIIEKSIIIIKIGYNKAMNLITNKNWFIIKEEIMLGVKEKLKEVMDYFDETFPTLAKYLGISYQALNKKVNGQSEFKVSEVAKIMQRYNLSAEEVMYIFFENEEIKSDDAE